MAGIAILPGAAGSVLIDQSPLGQLIVHSNDTQGALNGAQLKLAAAAPATSQAMGSRSLVLEWVPGPQFPADGVARVKIAISVTASWKLHLFASGAQPPGATVGAVCSLECEILGVKKDLFALAGAGKKPAVPANGETFADWSEALPPGALDRTLARNASFEARSSAELYRETPRTTPLTAWTRGSVAALADAAGLSADAALELTSDWKFEVIVEARR